MDTARLRVASQATAYDTRSSHRSSPSLHHSSRCMPLESASLPPQPSWLSDATEFSASPMLSSSLSGSVSRSVYRSPSRDHLSSPTAPSPGTRSRHTPSPIPSSSHTLHGARSFSSQHKSSGFSSDASGHLDLKRLMSKPAKQKQTPSGSISHPSDSERSGDGRVLSFSHRPGEPSRPPLSKSATASREKLSPHVSTSGPRSSSAPGHGRMSSSPDRRPFPGDTSSQTDKPRNVLRRRPSARSNPTTPITTQVRSPAEDSFPSRRTASARATVEHQPMVVHDDTVFSLHTRPLTSSTASASRPATSPRAKSSSLSSKGSQALSGLTPAGAVALAYKQQEMRREELAETASYTEGLLSRKPAAPALRKQESSSDWNDDHEGEGSGAYYTVFGGASGRLVAVGSPEDDLFYGTYETRSPTAVNGRPHASGTRSLSRKVSGSFKKVAGSMKRERDFREIAAPNREEGLPYDGSNASHVRKPITLDTSVAERIGSPSPARHSPGPKSSASPQDDGHGSRAKTRGKDEEMSPGGKWWKLMKRISTGGLRDKYHHSASEPPPPVPAIPGGIPPPSPRMTMDISTRGPLGEEVGENGVLLRRFMQSRASLSGVRPNLPSVTKTSSSSSRPSTGGAATAGRPSTGNTAKSRGSMSGHRPSTATQSSSPASEPTSFFHMQHIPSARSSFSSLDDVPPVPKNPKNLGQYIMSPSELSRVTKVSDVASVASKSTASTSKPVASTPNPTPKQHNRAHTAPPEDAHRRLRSLSDDSTVPSLPLPPRRAATTGTPVPSPSPVAPSFSVEETINNLMPPQLSSPPPLTEFGMQEPPPRPKRSSRRGHPSNPQAPSPSVPAPSRTQSVSVPRSPQTPRATPHMRVNTDLVRSPSTGALSYASTPHLASASASAATPGPKVTSPTSAPGSAQQKRSPLTFRELEGPRQRLTEREKAEKWADLLERSAAAGGTLRVGETRLMSDETESVSMLHLSDSD